MRRTRVAWRRCVGVRQTSPLVRCVQHRVRHRELVLSLLYRRNRRQVNAVLAEAEEAMKQHGVYRGLMGKSTWILSDQEYLVRLPVLHPFFEHL